MSYSKKSIKYKTKLKSNNHKKKSNKSIDRNRNRFVLYLVLLFACSDSIPT